MLPDFLTTTDWVFLASGALLMGMAKSGLNGVNIIAIPVYAALFGGKTSTSIILPLLLCGDLVAIITYHKKISWSHYLRLLPATILGLVAGMFLGNFIPDHSFRLVMAFIILICLILMLAKEFGRKNLAFPDHWAAHSLGGLSGGFTTMVGNAAGPIMSMYLLSMNLPKEVFIGTGAVFFLTVNVLKVPVHLFVWKTMTADTLLIDAVLALFVFAGFFAGLKIVKRIPEKPFRMLIIIATFLGTLKMFF